VQSGEGGEEGRTRTHPMSTVVEDSTSNAGGGRSGAMPTSFPGARWCWVFHGHCAAMLT
jgi:hypothetical protein